MQTWQWVLEKQECWIFLGVVIFVQFAGRTMKRCIVTEYAGAQREYAHQGHGGWGWQGSRSCLLGRCTFQLFRFLFVLC